MFEQSELLSLLDGLSRDELLLLREKIIEVFYAKDSTPDNAETASARGFEGVAGDD